MAKDINFLNNNSIANIDNNFARVKVALQDVVGRSGNLPNHMEADLDLNGNDLLNVGTIQAKDITIDGENPAGILERALEAVIEAELGADSAQAWAESDVAIPVEFGGDGVSTFSSKWWAEEASSISIPNGSISEIKISDALKQKLVTFVNSRTDLAAYDGSTYRLVYLNETNRRGFFRWVAGNQSALITSDPRQGFYVAPASAPTGASGAWYRIYEGPVNVMWFGASPAELDNTAIYNDIISILPNGTSIFWPSVSGTWKGHFIPAAARTFKLDLGGNTFSEVNQTSLFYMKGSASIVTTLTANTRVGQTTLAVTSSAGLAVGDLIMLEDGLVRPSDSEKINQEILKIKQIVSGTSIRVEDMVRSEQSVGTRNVYKIVPIVNPEIRNGKAVILNPWDEGNTGGNFSAPFRIDYASGAVMADTEARNAYGQAANMRYVYEYLMDRCKVFDSHNRELGGYGIQVYVGRKGLIRHSVAKNARNGVDLSSVYDTEVYEPDVDDCLYGVAVAHNLTGGKITVVRPNIRNLPANSGSRGITTSAQGVSNTIAMNYLLRDITILDADIHSLASVNGDTANLIFLETSVANLKISGVTARFPGTSTIPNSSTAIVRIQGQPFGICVVENIKTPPSYDNVDVYGVGYCVYADQTAASGVAPYGALIVRDSYNGFGQGVLYSAGVRNVMTQNLTHGQTIGTAVRSVNNKNGVTVTVNDSVGFHGRLT